MNTRSESIPLVVEGEAASVALDVMQFDGRRTVFVVNDSGRLLGVITEGDLAKVARSQPISRISCTEIMNPNPVLAKRDATDMQILELFASTGHLLFPVVEEATRGLVGVRSSTDAAANLLSNRS